MRVLVDIVENLTSSIRFIVGMLVLCGLGVGLMLTIGVSYVAPKAADSLGERAERVSAKAIRAAQEERRAKEMARDGWGYDAASASVGSGRGGSAKDGWGD
ncbi:MAG: hypothetical protein GC147_11640 [Porphyrobacter sp.]|nr:hypothetical protein [Porphyrobacter sp.]